ncbi:hypothetical protein [Derxia gummosa]|uniref:Uncharacterized protein n=1 Tax=Derxia gummosa DSM 723 TaxID=1121388 RepID=A0A8B6X1Q9_9BURK|nr:hypothetical protein [Derxia gummosa]
MTHQERVLAEQALALVEMLDARQGPISHVDLADLLAALRELNGRAVATPAVPPRPFDALRLVRVA